MTEHYVPVPYVAGFIEGESAVPRDEAAHALILQLAELLGPAPTDRVVVESFFEPSANAWKLVAHRVPARPGTPETPEEVTARTTLALEAALNSEEGRAIAASILERKRIAEYLDSEERAGVVQEFAGRLRAQRVSEGTA